MDGFLGRQPDLCSSLTSPPARPLRRMCFLQPAWTSQASPSRLTSLKVQCQSNSLPSLPPGMHMLDDKAEKIDGAPNWRQAGAGLSLPQPSLPVLGGRIPHLWSGPAHGGRLPQVAVVVVTVVIVMIVVVMVMVVVMAVVLMLVVLLMVVVMVVLLTMVEVMVMVMAMVVVMVMVMAMVVVMVVLMTSPLMSPSPE